MGHYSSFFIRVWQNDDGKLRGTIEHVASHQKLTFINLSSMMRFLQVHLWDAGDAVCPPHGEETSMDGADAEPQTPATRPNE